MKVLHGFLIVLHTLLGAGEMAQILTAGPSVANVATTVDSDESTDETTSRLASADLPCM